VNARERRHLARIERRLRFEDPELVRQFSRGGLAGTTAWLLDLALGLSVLLTSLAFFVGAIGLGVVLSAGVVALTVFRLRWRRSARRRS
jgi:Flp pilus assembly protein TadB